MPAVSKDDIIRAALNVRQDFKASVIAAELTDNGISPDTFFFRNHGTFKRSVSRDIEEISWKDIDDKQAYLVFELNREGIYDMVPEALTHNQSRKKAAHEDEKLGNELRQQERDARKFFSPLENEFHYRALKLDIMERELLKNNNPHRNREFFNHFFEDSSMLTDQQLLMLMHILPLSNKIRGDLALIALTITKILNFTVGISERWIKQHYSLPAHSGLGLSYSTLGTDTILNDHFTVSARYFEISVSGIFAKDYLHFTEGGKHMNVLNFMLPYFFPAAANYGICLQCNGDEAALELKGNNKMSFLGFNSYI